MALYFLVDWSCDAYCSTTLKICAWYNVASMVTCVVFYYLIHPNENQAHNGSNKTLVPTSGAALLFMLAVTRTRHPVSTLTLSPVVGTA